MRMDVKLLGICIFLGARKERKERRGQQMNTSIELVDNDNRKKGVQLRLTVRNNFRQRPVQHICKVWNVETC